LTEPRYEDLLNVCLQVGEAQLVDLLEKFSQQTQKKMTVKVCMYIPGACFLSDCYH